MSTHTITTTEHLASLSEDVDFFIDAEGEAYLLQNGFYIGEKLRNKDLKIYE